MSEKQTSQARFIRETFPVGPLQCNCTIIGDTQTGEGVVVDPGGDAELIMAKVDAHGLKIIAIYHTHAHLDHILAAGAIKEKTGAPIYLHDDDRFLWDILDQQCQLFRVPFQPQPAPDLSIKDEHDLGFCSGVALHTPGHTPGSTSFWFEDAGLLIAGDTLFKGAIGRTDLWGGSFPQIEKSIRERLFSLDEDATVVTGHGPDTSIGAEKESNPYVRA